MKKLIIAAFITLTALPALADDKPGLAQDSAPPPAHKQESGYRGMEDAQVMTIEHAKTMHDGASVSLQGNLIKKLGEDLYQFRDKSGTIDVMIPMSVFDGRSISPDHLVGINGTLDKKHKPARVTVRMLQKQ